MMDVAKLHAEEAGPSRPVQVQGLNGVPGAGDNLLVVEDDRVEKYDAREHGGEDAFVTYRIDDHAAQVTQAHLAHNFLGCLQVVAGDSLFEVAAGTGELAGAAVWRHACHRPH